MALNLLNEENIQHDLDAGIIDLNYANKLREVIHELINNRGWGGLTINNEIGEPCGDCTITIYYNSPTPGFRRAWQYWVWIKINNEGRCNLWVHVDYKQRTDRWAWSVWSSMPFYGGGVAENFRMPPEFEYRPIWKSANIIGELTEVFNGICGRMQQLCECDGVLE